MEAPGPWSQICADLWLVKFQTRCPCGAGTVCLDGPGYVSFIPPALALMLSGSHSKHH